MEQNEAIELTSSIATILKDYRQGEIAPITSQHVERWLEQFDEEDRTTILVETEQILRKRYISTARMEQDIQYLVADLLDSYSEFEWYKLEFLQIQRKGSSQRDLLQSILPEVLEFNPYFEEPEVYVYLDDCLFSGNSLIYDIEPWLEHENIRDAELCVLFHTIHQAGWRYAQQRLSKTFEERNVVCHWRAVNVHNNVLQRQHVYDCLWPTQVEEEPLTLSYVEKMHSNASAKGVSPRTFRPHHVEIQDNLFSSPQARTTVERAFLKFGSYIVSLPKQAKPEMRPLGYEYLESLGFGAMYMTYRNIANNCPLVLWWGDSSYPQSHPFSYWYPLLPRKSNV